VTDHDDEFVRGVGIGDSGAVLVRPDGYVAGRWRTAVARPGAAFGEAIETALGRSAQPAALAG
jgi:2,4-dichlorophenol 6-monooxygenase